MDDDYFLIRRMKNGDDNALEVFVRKYYQEILKFCYRNLNGSSLAEDITQETFVNFFRNLKRYEHYGKARNYLYTIAGNLCKNQYKRKVELTMDELYQASDMLEEDINTKLDMKNALMKLPTELREILILHYYQDFKLREIAAILEIGLPLAKYRMAKAKEKLRILLEGEDGNG
jgi:RNA polymerase sigma-70 factor (ECF subfamily)